MTFSIILWSMVLIFALQNKTLAKQAFMDTAVIIGGGASGVLAAIHLNRGKKFKTITLIEQDKTQLFRGVAYSSKLPYQPLNVSVGRMSAFSNEPDNFYNWLTKHQEKYPELENGFSKDSFVGRNIYGDYLEDLFSQETGNSINILEAKVTDIEDVSGKHKIYLDNGNILESDLTILAWGVPSPKSFHVPESKFYIKDAWKDLWVSDVDKDDPVIFIGTGLTMAEQAVSLHLSGHRGHIYVLSRRGRLPLAHVPTQDWQVNMSPGSPADETFRQLRANIQSAAEKAVNWQSVMDGLRPITSAIWNSWNADEKRRFLRHLAPFWEVHRHRMPKETSDYIHNMSNSGQLEILAGRIKDIVVGSDSVSLTYLPRMEQNIKTIQAKWLINCTGPGSINDPENALVQNLFSRGLISEDELKSGIRTDKAGHPVKADGSVWENVYTIGISRRPELWETTAMREIRSQAEEICRQYQ